jgi:hypothetical protein
MRSGEIIAALGGQTATARLLEVSVSRVSNWPRNGIPSGFWLRIAELAAQRDASKHITLETLATHEPGIAEQEKAPEPFRAGADSAEAA